MLTENYITINALRHSIEVKDKRIIALEAEVAELNAFLDAYRKENKAMREVFDEIYSEE